MDPAPSNIFKCFKIEKARGMNRKEGAGWN